MKQYYTFDELDVKVVVGYVDSAKKIYSDADKTKQFTKDELKNAFLMGMVIDLGNGTLARPTSLTTSGVVVGENTYTPKAS